jgi:hypothetical protein
VVVAACGRPLEAPIRRITFGFHCAPLRGAWPRETRGFILEQCGRGSCLRSFKLNGGRLAALAWATAQLTRSRHAETK